MVALTLQKHTKKQVLDQSDRFVGKAYQLLQAQVIAHPPDDGPCAPAKHICCSTVLGQKQLASNLLAMPFALASTLVAVCLRICSNTLLPKANGLNSEQTEEKCLQKRSPLLGLSVQKESFANVFCFFSLLLVTWALLLVATSY